MKPGYGVAFTLEELAIVEITRSGVRWKFSRASRVHFGTSSIGERVKRTAAAVQQMLPSLVSWIAIRDPWGLVSGSGRSETKDVRRLVLCTGQLMQCAIFAGVEPVLFEPGEIRRGLGVSEESDIRRLGACVRAMVLECPAEMSGIEVEATATAVMGGRHAMAPAALTKGKAL